MLNSLEHTKIKIEDLPPKWTEDDSLRDLQMFLQENWDQRHTFYRDGKITSKQQFIDFDVRNGIKTQNYIGTISFRGEQLNIFPKVFQEDDDDDDYSHLNTDELIRNLLIWIEYCDKSIFPFISNKSELYSTNSMLELFITLYLKYVKETLDRQLFYQYEDVSETGSMIKGKINFKDYIQNKYPNGNRHIMEYTYSSFIFDNKLNRIIKCVCKGLKNITNINSNKDLIKMIITKLGSVTDINAKPYDCDEIFLDPLHSNYTSIISMSKMFLLNKTSTNELGIADSFCFLFPAELLFEGFIGGFMKETFGAEMKVKTQASDQYLAEVFVDGESYGNVFQLREDILVDNDGKIVVLDTKYKPIDQLHKVRENKKLGVSDADIKQMAIYASKRNAEKLYLLYPLWNKEEIENIEIRYDIDVSENGTKKIPLFIVKIPFIFGDDVESTLNVLKATLKKTL